MITSLARRLLGIRLGVLYQHPPRPLAYRGDIGILEGREGLPSISIVTPSFNQGEFIGPTIESVLAQAYPDLQYLIQDAGSTDRTHAVIAAFPSQVISCCIEADHGQADAINRGFAKTHGEIMAWLNSDDLLLPGALHLVGDFFRRHPGVDVVYGNRIIIDSAGHEVGRWILPGHDSRVLRHIDYVPQETLFWRRRIWERIGGCLDDSLSFALDWDLLLRFCDAGAHFAHLPTLFGVFRVHEAQKTTALIGSAGREEMRLLRRRYNGNFLQQLRSTLQHGLFLAGHKISDYRFRHGARPGTKI